MSGAVYQPTTVTYESSGPQESWRESRPISYLANISQTATRPCGISCFSSRNIWPIVLISSCTACFTIGLVMIIQGALNYADTTEGQEKTSFDLVITIFGAFLFAFSILLFIFFLRLTRRMCWRNTKTHIDTTGNQALTVNPSTDLLVAAQYAPVSEVHYEQTKPGEIDEHRNLMSHENKELTNEDTDRMVENDPRIVLRPLNAAIPEEA